jgi:sec-independent protein translocase protein TatB
MFNVTGGEIVIILVLALVVLGPEKLPEMIRKAGRLYGELRRMSSGFQSEFEEAFGEPLREFRETANQARDMIKNPLADHEPVADTTDTTADPARAGADALASAPPLTPEVISGSEPPYAPVVSAPVEPQRSSDPPLAADLTASSDVPAVSPFAPPIGSALPAPSSPAPALSEPVAPIPEAGSLHPPVAPLAAQPAAWDAPTARPQANPWPSPEADS